MRHSQRNNEDSSRAETEPDDCNCTTTHRSDSDENNENEKEIWYFGYGPIINPMVRNRRGVNTLNEQAAILPEHQLTFAFGGVANIVPRRGYDVHGILMQLSSKEDWMKLQEFDKGGFKPKLLQVFPYNTHNTINNEEEKVFPDQNPSKAKEEAEQEGNDDDDEEEEYYNFDNNDDDDDKNSDNNNMINCYVFVMDEFDSNKLEEPLEKKPQERYLRLIAQGMRECKVDEDYINDEIMAVPFINKRKPNEWLSFPLVNEKKYKNDSNKLPTISYTKYEKICSPNKNKDDSIYFILGQYVFKCILDDMENTNNAGTRWFRENAHGQPDICWKLHLLVIDPDIPFCYTEDDLCSEHYAWAENHIYELMQSFSFSAVKMYKLKKEKTKTTKSKTIPSTTTAKRRTSNRRRSSSSISVKGKDLISSSSSSRPSSSWLRRLIKKKDKQTN